MIFVHVNQSSRTWEMNLLPFLSSPLPVKVPDGKSGTGIAPRLTLTSHGICLIKMFVEPFVSLLISSLFHLTSLSGIVNRTFHKADARKDWA